MGFLCWLCLDTLLRLDCVVVPERGVVFGLPASFRCFLSVADIVCTYLFYIPSRLFNVVIHFTAKMQIIQQYSSTSIYYGVLSILVGQRLVKGGQTNTQIM